MLRIWHIALLTTAGLIVGLAGSILVLLTQPL